MALAAVSGCKRPPDPLADQRALCKSLEERKQLRAGLTLDQCAQQLKAADDLKDPALRADELVDRVSALAAASKGNGSLELTDTLTALEQIGRPAIPATLAKMKSSGNADARLALAKVLVATCAQDCAEARYSCIVPALLEGLGDDKPGDVRRKLEVTLTHCTGEQLGDDPAAWRSWWASKEASQAAAQAAAH